MSERVLNGHCLCGAVRYEAWGEPLFSGFCYCEDCRRASGAGASPIWVTRRMLSG